MHTSYQRVKAISARRIEDLVGFGSPGSGFLPIEIIPNDHLYTIVTGEYVR